MLVDSHRLQPVGSLRRQQQVVDADAVVLLPGAGLIVPEGVDLFRVGGGPHGLGLTDALRAVNDAPGQYTFWDYQAGAWQKNWGIRIDHLLLSPQASDRLTNVGIDSYVRAWEKPSDHVPVWVDLDLETRG